MTGPQPTRPVGERRLTLRPQASTRWGLGDVAVAYIAGNLLSVISLQLVGDSGRATTVGAHLAALAGLWMGMLGGAILASRLRGSGQPVLDYQVSFRPIDTPIGITIGALLQLAIVPVVSWPIIQIWNIDIADPARDLLDIAGPRWLLFAAVIVGAPIVEEIFFRGLLLRGLAKHFEDRIAVILSAAIFAGTHFQLAQFLGLFVVGVVFAELVRRTGRLGPAVAAHMAFNATAVALLA